MALKKETLQKIASILHIKDTDLEAAIKADTEIDITIDDKLTVFTETELKTLKDNEYSNGKKAGAEMEVKTLKDELKLDFQGKSVKGLVEAAQKKALDDAKVTPDKAVKELQDKVTTLQGTVKEYETKLAEKDTEVTGVKINGELIKHIPKFDENGPALSPDDVIAIMSRKGYEFKLENGKVVPYKDGKQIQDKTANAREAKDVVGEFLIENKFVSKEITPGGRGAGDQRPGAKAGKLSEIKEQFVKEGKSLLGADFSKAVEQAMAANKEFDLQA